MHRKVTGLKHDVIRSKKSCWSTQHGKPVVSVLNTNLVALVKILKAYMQNSHSSN